LYGSALVVRVQVRLQELVRPVRLAVTVDGMIALDRFEQVVPCRGPESAKASRLTVA
jgi:hypothetical protein